MLVCVFTCNSVDGPGSISFPNIDLLLMVVTVSCGTLLTNLAASILSMNSLSSIESDLAFKSRMKDLAETRFVR